MRKYDTYHKMDNKYCFWLAFESLREAMQGYNRVLGLEINVDASNSAMLLSLINNRHLSVLLYCLGSCLYKAFS